MTRASPCAFKYEAEFRAGQGSELEDGTSLADRCPAAWPRMCHQSDRRGASLQLERGPSPCSDRTPPCALGKGREREGEGGARAPSASEVHSASLPAAGEISPPLLPPLQRSVAATCKQLAPRGQAGAIRTRSWGYRDTPLSSRSPSSRWQDLWSAAPRATRGLLHCLETSANSCLLGAQPGWGQQGGSLGLSTVRKFEAFLLKRSSSPVD